MGLCDNRTIIITGAGGGLGRAYAIALGAAGGNVVVNDINPDTAAETVKIINDAGGQAIVNLDDITDYASAGKILATTIEHFGDVHAVVNNAGNNRDRMFTSLSEDDWDDVIRVHLKGHFACHPMLRNIGVKNPKMEKTQMHGSSTQVPALGFKALLGRPTMQPQRGEF